MPLIPKKAPAIATVEEWLEGHIIARMNAGSSAYALMDHCLRRPFDDGSTPCPIDLHRIRAPGGFSLNLDERLEPQCVVLIASDNCFAHFNVWKH